MNASLMNEKYELVNQPFLLEVKKQSYAMISHNIPLSLHNNQIILKYDIKRIVTFLRHKAYYTLCL